VQPGVIVADSTYPPATYTAYTIDDTGHLSIIGALSTVATTDHLVAAWTSSTDCSGLSISRNAWVADATGGVIGENDLPGPPANNFGDMSGHPLNQPVVGMSPTSDGLGYWLVAADGGIFAFGDAQFYGSMGGHPLNRPITGMAVTPDGRGYWLVASDGGVFSFGDAPFYGSTGSLTLNKPIEAMVATPDGHGYWMVASDGGIFAFGDAAFHGSMGGQTLSAPISGMIPNGSGYTLIGQDGQLYPFS
jgi:ribosomal protein L24E